MRVMQTIIKHKLGLFGHICRKDNKRLIKTVMLGTVEGKNKVGRPKRKWSDDLIEWSNTALHEVTKMADKRETWRRRTKVIVDTYGQHNAQGD